MRTEPNAERLWEEKKMNIEKSTLKTNEVNIDSFSENIFPIIVSISMLCYSNATESFSCSSIYRYIRTESIEKIYF